MKSLWQAWTVICLVSASSVFVFADRNADIIIIDDATSKIDRQSAQSTEQTAITDLKTGG